MEALMTDPRILPLEGVENFRDYGGYAVRGGASPWASCSAPPIRPAPRRPIWR